MADDDDRPRDAGSAADRFGGTAGDSSAQRQTASQDTAWADATAPDDISELARDVRAYRRELRTKRRQAKYGRFFGAPASEPLTLLGCALVLAAVIAAGITLVQPKAPTTAPGKVPLATTVNPAAQPGSLVPSVELASYESSNATPVTHPVNAQNLRPAVLALMPLQCRCRAVIGGLVTEADSYQVAVDLIAPAAADAEVASLTALQTNAEPRGYYDRAHQLATKFQASTTGVTLVIVGANGIISKVERGITSVPQADLGAALTTMQKPKAAAS